MRGNTEMLFVKRTFVIVLTLCLVVAGFHITSAQGAKSGRAGTLRIRFIGCAIGKQSVIDLSRSSVLVRTGNVNLDNSLQEDLTALDRVFQINAPVYFLNDNTLN